MPAILPLRVLPESCPLPLSVETTPGVVSILAVAYHSPDSLYSDTIFTRRPLSRSRESCDDMPVPSGTREFMMFQIWSIVKPESVFNLLCCRFLSLLLDFAVSLRRRIMGELIARRQFNEMYIWLDLAFLVLFAALLVWKKIHDPCGLDLLWEWYTCWWITESFIYLPIPAV